MAQLSEIYCLDDLSLINCHNAYQLMTNLQRTIRFARLLTALCLLLAGSLSYGKSNGENQHTFDQWFASAAKAHGVPEVVLRSICELESKGNPWAVNINGIGFQPESKEAALTLIEATQKRPWVLTLRYATHEPQVSFFRTEKHARKALNEIYQNNRRWYLNNPVAAEIRKLDMRSVDIGLMQINHLFHGRHFDSKAELFDPETNINYAAKYLRRLMTRHGTLKKAVAFYHSNTHKYQTIYLSLFWPIYQQYAGES